MTSPRNTFGLPFVKTSLNTAQSSDSADHDLNSPRAAQATGGARAIDAFEVEQAPRRNRKPSVPRASAPSPGDIETGSTGVDLSGVRLGSSTVKSRLRLLLKAGAAGGAIAGVLTGTFFLGRHSAAKHDAAGAVPAMPQDLAAAAGPLAAPLPTSDNSVLDFMQQVAAESMTDFTGPTASNLTTDGEVQSLASGLIESAAHALVGDVAYAAATTTGIGDTFGDMAARANPLSGDDFAQLATMTSQQVQAADLDGFQDYLQNVNATLGAPTEAGPRVDVSTIPLFFSDDVEKDTNTTAAGQLDAEIVDIGAFSSEYNEIAAGLGAIAASHPDAIKQAITKGSIDGGGETLMVKVFVADEGIDHLQIAFDIGNQLPGNGTLDAGPGSMPVAEQTSGLAGLVYFFEQLQNFKETVLGAHEIMQMLTGKPTVEIKTLGASADDGLGLGDDAKSAAILAAQKVMPSASAAGAMRLLAKNGGYVETLRAADLAYMAGYDADAQRVDLGSGWFLTPVRTHGANGDKVVSTDDILVGQKILGRDTEYVGVLSPDLKYYVSSAVSIEDVTTGALFALNDNGKVFADPNLAAAGQMYEVTRTGDEMIMLPQEVLERVASSVTVNVDVDDRDAEEAEVVGRRV